MLLVPLRATSITPNQVTLLTLVVFAVGATMMAMCPSWRALVIAAGVIELSYVLDCVDGQLARLKGTSSPVGAHLDFLMDELKAFCSSPRSAFDCGAPAARILWLVEGLLGLVIVASAIGLTTFMRRPEYAAATGAKVGLGAGDYGAGFGQASDGEAASGGAASAGRKMSPFRLLEALGKFIVHYPSYILFVALAGRIDLFLHAYVLMNGAYAARSLLGITLRLGRRTRTP